jgi:hypothetical protein
VAQLQFIEWHRAVEGGHVDKDVEATEVADRLVHSSSRLIGYRQVRGKDVRLAAERAHGFSCLFGLRAGGTVDQGDVRATSGQFGGDDSPDSLPACHERYSAGEIHGRSVYVDSADLSGANRKKFRVP